LLVLALALGVFGCGADNIAPVSGRITIDGEPAPNVRVTFQPMGSTDNPEPGAGSYGFTDDDGRYELKMVGSNRSGAIIGKHHVQLKSSNGPSDEFPNAPPKPAKMIPKEYNKESKLEFDVPKGGSKTADWDVKTR
jgi:hypothetical protein